MSHKTVMLSSMETLLLALTSALACLSWLGSFWVCSVCELYICTVFLKSNEGVFLRGFVRHKVVQGSVKTGLPTVCNFCPAEPPSSPGAETHIFLSLRSSILESFFTLFPSAGKPATAELCAGLETLKTTRKHVGGSDSWEKKKWGERSRGCWAKLSWFKLEKHTF